MQVRALIVTLRIASSELILARRASEGCAAAFGDSLACASGLYGKLTIKAQVLATVGNLSHVAQVAQVAQVAHEEELPED